MHPLRLLVPALLIGACTSDPAPPSAIVGSWRAVPSAFDTSPRPPEDRLTYTFDSDGSLLYEEGGLSQRTSYEVDGDQVSMNLVGTFETSAFHVNDARLLLQVRTRSEGPAGEGPVGTWTQSSSRGTVIHGQVLVLRADQSGSFAERTGEGSWGPAQPATWTQIDNDLEITLEGQSPGAIGIRTTLLDDLLGTPFERL